MPASERLTAIRLHDVIPNVFANDAPSGSEVWLREVDFVRPDNYFVKATSGAGKSSLCAFIYGSRSDYRGRISFEFADGRQAIAADLSPKQWSHLRCHSLAYLPQDLRLFPELTVMENIEIKNRLTGLKTSQQIETMLERLGMERWRNSRAGHLSVGQQQRVALVRALCQPFDFLLLDEPVSHLDEHNNEAAAALVEEEAAAREASVIATSVGNDILLRFPKILRL